MQSKPLSNPIHILAKTFAYFKAQHCVQYASSLSYSTLLAIVPMAALLFFLSLQTEIFSSLFDDVRTQLLDQLLPTSREQVEAYLLQTAKNIKSFSYLGIAFIFLSALLLSTGIEGALNHIWEVENRRRFYLRWPTHIILWVIAPILFITSITLSTWLFSLPYLQALTSQTSYLSKALPWLFSSFALYLLYYYVPNSKIRQTYALIAACTAGMLFELSKWTFAIYITQYANYEKLYGALATLPIFMLWVWISWLLVLWGATLCVTLQRHSV